MEQQTNKEDLAIKMFLEKQDKCLHTKFAPCAQHPIPEGRTRTVILMTTVICVECGKPFVQTIGTNISIGTFQQPAPGIFK